MFNDTGRYFKLDCLDASRGNLLFFQVVTIYRIYIHVFLQLFCLQKQCHFIGFISNFLVPILLWYDNHVFRQIFASRAAPFADTSMHIQGGAPVRNR